MIAYVPTAASLSDKPPGHEWVPACSPPWGTAIQKQRAQSWGLTDGTPEAQVLLSGEVFAQV